MGRIEQLLSNYKQTISLPWSTTVAGAEKIWFCVYNKMDERRLRPRVGEFEIASKQEGHGWYLVDLTETFAEWLSSEDYREEYFQDPEDITPALDEFEEAVSILVLSVLEKSTENDVVTICGIASLFGFMKVSDLINAVKDKIKGRLVVFFPGEYDDNNSYRMLDARDGWNYLATPITSHERTL
ncbi:BREX protein BrxB domain-containing protein [Planctomycetota bacterium]